MSVMNGAMNRVRVKVCGMREVEQVKSIVSYGVDAIGMIFYDKSERNVSLEQAKKIRKVVPPFVNLVGVFVDKSAEAINSISSEVGLDVVQLHGDQSPEFATQLKTPYLRAIRVKSASSIVDVTHAHKEARGFLLDTFSDSAYGGTGHRIDGELLPVDQMNKYILAGGINPDNIESILQLKPYAIDINSGVEKSPANKDMDKVRKVMSAVKMSYMNS